MFEIKLILFINAAMPVVMSATKIGNGEARLVGGAGPWEGTVEIYHNGLWGTVCDRDFDMKDARVVCRMLGYGREIQVFPGAHFGQGNGSVLISYVSCSGNEQSIGSCGYRDGSCSHSYDVGVSCVRTDRQETTEGVRLIGGTGPYEGTVELNVNGKWGTVCDYSFDINDADVICRMAGFPRAIQAFTRSHFGHGNGTSMLYNLHCSGHEDHLDSCGSTGWYKSTCGHDQDAGVSCLSTNRQFTSEGIRLVGGESDSEGTIELMVNGRWGTICDYNFDKHDADVICRMAGYSRALQFFKGAHFGQGNGTTLLSNLQCSGNEARIDSCGSDGWYKATSYSSCLHNSDAGVVCLRNGGKFSTEGIRLVGGSGPFEGRVEINVNGIWGTICGSSFDLSDGEVICKMAGYSSALQVFASANRFGEGSGRIYLDSLQCTGHEKHVDSCSSSGLLNTNCRHSSDVGVVCLSGNSSEIAQGVRLVGGFKPWEGRIELKVNGQWGTICDTAFDKSDAEVICRMMGYSGKITVHNAAYYGRGSGPVLLTNVQCAGHEDHIDSCGSSGWYNANCGHGDDAGVSCNADNTPMQPIFG